MLAWLCVYCLDQGADLHMAKLMPLPLTISCSSKSRLVLPFWCRLTWVVPDEIQEGHKTVVCVYAIGSSRPVRRQEFPPDSLPAAGVMWQWEGDSAGEWRPYSIEVASLLEKGQQCCASSVDLNRHPFYLPYVVHLSSMVQIRTVTNYKRRVRRLALPQPYMPASSNFSHAPSSLFPAQVFQPSNAAMNGLSGSSVGGTSLVNPGSAMFQSPFLNGLSFGFCTSSTAFSVPAARPLYSGGGLHGPIAVSTVFGGSGNASLQKPLFTIGRSTSLDGTPKRKRVLLRDLAPGNR